MEIPLNVINKLPKIFKKKHIWDKKNKILLKIKKII